MVFVAWDVEIKDPAEPEPTEEIQLELVPAYDALRRAETGEIQNAACALALLMARPVL